MNGTDGSDRSGTRTVYSVEVYKLHQHQTKPCIYTFLVLFLDEWLVFTPQSSHLSHFRYKDTNPTKQ